MRPGDEGLGTPQHVRREKKADPGKGAGGGELTGAVARGTKAAAPMFMPPAGAAWAWKPVGEGPNSTTPPRVRGHKREVGAEVEVL